MTTIKMKKKIEEEKEEGEREDLMAITNPVTTTENLNKNWKIKKWCATKVGTNATSQINYHCKYY